MFNGLIILASLFLASEKTSPQSSINFLMLFSDALPVQLWPVNCLTHNQHEAQGVHHKCFFAPWQCDDEIKIQFKDEVNQSFSLLILDEDEVVQDTIDVEEFSPGYYRVAFVPADNSPGFCEEKILLNIQQNAGVQGFSLPELSTWLSGGSGDVPWTLGSSPSISLLALEDSEYLYVDFSFIEGIEYSIWFNHTGAGNLFRQGDIVIMDSLFNILWNDGGVNNLGTNESDVFTFTAIAGMTRIGIKLSSTFSGGSLTINSVSGTRSLGTNSVVAKSDWLDLKIEQPTTVLINYSNHRNFAGINYETSSPENDFYIRVPAVFFHQRFPEEDEVMELSSSLATLNGTLRKQRLFDTDYLPYYFHEKLKLILKHQNVTMLDRQWVKQEAYEIVEGDRRWPVKKARCWLSEKDFVHRNIL